MTFDPGLLSAQAVTIRKTGMHGKSRPGSPTAHTAVFDLTPASRYHQPVTAFRTFRDPVSRQDTPPGPSLRPAPPVVRERIPGDQFPREPFPGEPSSRGAADPRRLPDGLFGAPGTARPADGPGSAGTGGARSDPRPPSWPRTVPGDRRHRISPGCFGIPRVFPGVPGKRGQSAFQIAAGHERRARGTSRTIPDTPDPARGERSSGAAGRFLPGPHDKSRGERCPSRCPALPKTR
jgi:hypothetical protein